jgi:pheromone shutdown protein TraB
MLVHAEATRKGRRIEELESNVRVLRNRFTLTFEESVAEIARVVERLERDSAYRANDEQSSRELRLLLSGQVESAYEAFRTQVCRGATLGSACDKLVEGRNAYLATRIDQLFQSGQKVVAVVGAAHVAGPKSVLAELRARGYTVRGLSPRP